MVIAVNNRWSRWGRSSGAEQPRWGGLLTLISGRDAMVMDLAPGKPFDKVTLDEWEALSKDARVRVLKALVSNSVRMLRAGGMQPEGRRLWLTSNPGITPSGRKALVEACARRLHPNSLLVDRLDVVPVAAPAAVEAVEEVT